MPKPHLSVPHYDQGRALYTRGGTLADLINATEAVEEQARTAGEYNSDAAPSVITGFADGLLADVRRLLAHNGLVGGRVDHRA